MLNRSIQPPAQGEGKLTLISFDSVQTTELV